MSGKSARRKGHDFERWLVKDLTKHGWTARRGLQAHGGESVPDIIVSEWPLSEIHHEAKSYKRMAIYAHIEQAISDARGKDYAVPFKADYKEPHIVIPWSLYEEWARWLREVHGNQNWWEKLMRIFE